MFLSLVSLGLWVAVLVLVVLTYNRQGQANSKLAEQVNKQSAHHKQQLQQVYTRLDSQQKDTTEQIRTQVGHVVTSFAASQARLADEVKNHLRNPFHLGHLGNVGKKELFRLRNESQAVTVEEEAEEVDYQPFADVCWKAAGDETAFQEFRQDPAVIDMLDHVPPETGRQLVEMTSAFHVDIPWEIIAQQDRVGHPATVITCEPPGDDPVTVSPTTARYVVFALQAGRHLRASVKTSDPLHVIEIGGGFGGQCAMMHRILPLFDLQITSYTILDLEARNALQRRYIQTQLRPEDLEHVSCRSLAQDGNLRDTLRPGSFLFSAYAYSEISQTSQAAYNAVLSGLIDHGFVLWNSKFPPHGAFYRMIDRQPQEVQVIHEQPQTGPFNFLYLF